MGKPFSKRHFQSRRHRARAWTYLIERSPRYASGFFSAGVLDPDFDDLPGPVLADDLPALLDGSGTGQLTINDTRGQHTNYGSMDTPMLDPNDRGLSLPDYKLLAQKPTSARRPKRKKAKHRTHQLSFKHLLAPPITNPYVSALVMPDD